MSARPVWAIFGFVTSSILVAGVYHSLTLSQTGTGLALTESRARLPSWAQLGFGSDAQDRQCPETGPEGNHATAVWRDLPPIFRSARYKHGGEFQMNCLTASAEAIPALTDRLESECPLSMSSGNTCLRQDEVQVTYNVLLDVTDCFEISQREFLPLIASQTGPRLHLVAIEQKEHAGLLTLADWQQFRRDWPELLPQLRASEKNSCRQLASLFQKTDIPQDLAFCQARALPQESLIVLLASARHFAHVTTEIRDLWDPSLIDPLLAQLDTRIEDRMNLRYWTHLLAYFTGPAQALQIAKSYVEKRNRQNMKIKPGELSWAPWIKTWSDSRRRPASVKTGTGDSEDWPSYLEKNLEARSVDKMARVAGWLNWVRHQDLAGSCATDLWTADLEDSP